jgi:hypothetical protein
MIWGFGGGISYTHNEEISTIIEDLFPDIAFPRAECIFDRFINPESQQGFLNWSSKIP